MNAKMVKQALILGLALGTFACSEQRLDGEHSQDISTALTPAPVFPLAVSANRRYLVDSDGNPFPILGEAGWEAPHSLTFAELTTYVDDRAARGFTANFSMTFAHDASRSPPRNRNGDLPFSRRLDGATWSGSLSYTNVNTQAPDYTFPSEPYWAFFDSYVSLLESRGQALLLCASYMGFQGGNEGWGAEMVANVQVIGAGGFVGQPWANPSRSKLFNYGAWLANRYRASKNIIWVHSCDHGSGIGGNFTTSQKSAVNDIFAGMKSVSGQQSMLHTMHFGRESLATDVSFSAGTVDLQAVYSGNTTAQWGRMGYAHDPPMPAFEIEDTYEGAAGGEPNRRFQWWAQFTHIGGAFFGNETLWRFGTNWTSALNTRGAQDMTLMNGFVSSIAWQELVPSGLAGMKNLITAGGGTASPQSSDYVAAAAAPSGGLLVAYVPPAHTGPITVDMTAMAAGGSSLARWFNPFNGAYTTIGSFPNTGTRVFTPPGNNGSGFSDWVLILTPAVASARPTVASAASANPNPVTGTTTNLSVLGADDGGEANLTYTWAATGNPPASVSFSANGTNGAKNTTATFSQSGSYALQATIGDAQGQTVTSSVIVSVTGTFNTVLNVNFQIAGAPVPAGYQADTGAPFGNRGNGASYGWNVGHGDVTRDRESNPDQRLDTLCHFHAGGRWELQVANGSYNVKVSIGDPSFASTHTINVEGVSYFGNLALEAGQFRELNRAVTVSDGRLTIDQGNLPDKSTRINYVEVSSSGSANQPPSIATAAAATPNPVSATTSALSVLGADDGGEGALAYTWSTTGTPPAAVTFNPNGNNPAKNTTATFTRAGSYTLQATVRDAGNLTATSSVNVNVQQNLTSVVVSPAAATLAPNGTQQFTATGSDQFGFALSPAPTFGWLTNGGGTISASGLFTAGGASGGPFTITASSGGRSGTASVTIGSTFLVRINFQLPSTQTPAGYFADTGLAFGNRGNGFSYGWNVDNGAQARERNAGNSPDKRYDSLSHLQQSNNPNASWEIAVPNGSYSVRIVSGDPSWLNSVYRLAAEGVIAIDGTPSTSQLWFDRTVVVTVSDGRLSVTNAAGSSNNKINFIEISGL